MSQSAQWSQIQLGRHVMGHRRPLAGGVTETTGVIHAPKKRRDVATSNASDAVLTSTGSKPALSSIKSRRILQEEWAS
jgi:hypothetical protein